MTGDLWIYWNYIFLEETLSPIATIVAIEQ